MAKDPAFPWYASDFVTDTIQWTRAMQGLHCYLLSISWVNRGLTVTPTGIPTGLQPSDAEIWNQIKDKWQLVGGAIVQPEAGGNQGKEEKLHFQPIRQG